MVATRQGPQYKTEVKLPFTFSVLFSLARLVPEASQPCQAPTLPGWCLSGLFLLWSPVASSISVHCRLPMGWKLRCPARLCAPRLLHEADQSALAALRRCFTKAWCSSELDHTCRYLWGCPGKLGLMFLSSDPLKQTVLKLFLCLSRLLWFCSIK